MASDEPLVRGLAGRRNDGRSPPGTAAAEAETTGHSRGWWFIRKSDVWRLRVLPAAGMIRPRPPSSPSDDNAGRPERDPARPTVIYEPETYRFGGPEAMVIAHRLFHADSRHILQHLAGVATGDDHRRELGLRLGTRLMTPPARTSTSRATSGLRSPSTGPPAAAPSRQLRPSPRCNCSSRRERQPRQPPVTGARVADGL